ncbi:MAG: hypothetical protein NVV68_12430 [Dokdonella sp.]|nr:hypothetical protein [Dokdonella sp.]
MSVKAWATAALFVLLFAAGLPCRATGVGIAALEIADPVGGGSMSGYLFYPGTAPADGTTTLGPYTVAATRDAPALAGARPLIVISHGQAGSSLGHHDLATALAAAGFVVATIEHPADNHRDAGGVGTSAVLVGRPVQVSATIDALLADTRWKDRIDPRRIGVAGYSVGGYTALMAVGAVPRFVRLIGYCTRHRRSGAICNDARRLAAEARTHGLSLQAYLAGVQDELTRWGPTADPRIRAAFVMAPLGLLFDAPGLAAVDRPVFLAYGEHDEILLPPENALHVKREVKTLDGVRAVPKADHWVFLAPCSAALAESIPELCRDPDGVDRAAVHAQVDADAVAFFRRTLDVAGD